MDIGGVFAGVACPEILSHLAFAVHKGQFHGKTFRGI